MKTVRELRSTLRFNPEPCSCRLKHMNEKVIDYDVYLPTKGMHLQRDFVWTIDQKRELIWSILISRQVPRIAMINIMTPETGTEGVYQVIDGKQRLSSMLDFFNNKFQLEIDGDLYFYNELPEEYQRAIACYAIPYLIVNDDYGKPITDQEKIDWFKYINFAGTSQDSEHFKLLSK